MTLLCIRTEDKSEFTERYNLSIRNRTNLTFDFRIL